MTHVRLGVRIKAVLFKDAFYVCVCVFMCVSGCQRVSVSVNDLWFVFTVPYFGLACRHRRMNDKLRMSDGFTQAPVVPHSPGRVVAEIIKKKEQRERKMNINAYLVGMALILFSFFKVCPRLLLLSCFIFKSHFCSKTNGMKKKYE